MSQVHPQARTTPRTRGEMQAAEATPLKELARRYNVTPATARKWKHRVRGVVRACGWTWLMQSTPS